MAMKHSRFVEFSAAMTSLSLMHILSAWLGSAVSALPKIFLTMVSALLFGWFGFQQLKEASGSSQQMDNSDNEVEEELEEVGKGINGTHNATNSECNILHKIAKMSCYVSPVFLEAFILNFLAEWGDRSQISTIILGARGENMTGIIMGGVVAHGLSNFIAVVGGHAISESISPQIVAILGGITFLIIAATTLIFGTS